MNSLLVEENNVGTRILRKWYIGVSMADAMEVKRGIFGASISWNDIINQKEASQSLKKNSQLFYASYFI